MTLFSFGTAVCHADLGGYMRWDPGQTVVIKDHFENLGDIEASGHHSTSEVPCRTLRGADGEFSVFPQTV